MRLIFTGVLTLFAMLAGTMAVWAAPSKVVSVGPGREARLGVFAIVHADCSTGAAPEIRVTRAPMHGVLVLQNVSLSTKRVQNCPVITAPARQILYRATAGFTGQDEATFAVVDPATGNVDLHPVTLSVQALPTKI